MSTTGDTDKSEAKHRHTPVAADDTEAAIIAGGEIVGTTVDDEPLVEGPNSK